MVLLRDDQSLHRKIAGITITTNHNLHLLVCVLYMYVFTYFILTTVRGMAVLLSPN